MVPINKLIVLSFTSLVPFYVWLQRFISKMILIFLVTEVNADLKYNRQLCKTFG